MESKPSNLSAMDRPVSKWRKWRRRGLWLGSILLLIILVLLFVVPRLLNTEQTLVINRNTVMIEPVKEGVFSDVIPLRGNTLPKDVILLDIVESGRVEEVYTEAGQKVKARQKLVRLKNTERELYILGNITNIESQINNLRGSEVNISQSRHRDREVVSRSEFEIQKLEGKIKRERPLAEKGIISQAKLEEYQDALAYYNRVLKDAKETQRQNEELRVRQITSIKSQAESLNNNLELARKQLSSFIIRAPTGGVLTSLEVKIGENKNQGARIGEIDKQTGFKIEALVNEYYLARVRKGQKASFLINNQNIVAEVVKIFPEVKQGSFKVDFGFNTNSLKNIRAGQTLQGQLNLGGDTEAILIPNKAFMQTTNGRWVFVVNEDGHSAVRKEIQTGRRNTKNVEVLKGLKPGEHILTSDYSTYKDIERINIK